eukprot:5720709-Pyramimonas_sp.AAC.2
MRDIGFEQLQFETADFKLMNQGQLVGRLCLRVDDVLMAFDMENNKEFCDHVIQQLRSQVQFGDWHDLQNAQE